MINFIKRFLTAMTDEEINYLRVEVYQECELRAVRKRQEFGSELPELDANEKAYAEGGNKIEAIKAYRNRTGHLLKQAKDAVEDWLRKPV